MDDIYDEWAKYLPKEFLLELISEMRTEAGGTVTVAKLILKDPDLCKLKIAEAGELTVGQACEYIVTRGDKLLKLANIASKYNKEHF